MKEENKRYLALICEETNVKQTSFKIAKTERGDLYLNYILEEDHYNFTINDEVYYSEKIDKFADNIIEKILCQEDRKEK